MGSHHCQVAILVPDDKLECFDLLRKKFCSDKNGLAFYLGPVLLSRADGAQFVFLFIGQNCRADTSAGLVS